MKKSKKELWTGFNLGRILFKTPKLEAYDRFLARMFHRILRDRRVAVEYGCGDGAWLEYLASNYPGKEFIGVEWNETAYNYAMTVRKPGLENLSFIMEDMSEVDGVLTCDVCWSLGGIEHFSESAKVLKMWVDEMMPDGRCFLTTPNLLHRTWIEARHGLKPEDYLGKDRVAVDTYGYAEIWAPNHFFKVAMEAGLEVIELGEISCLEYEKPRYLIGIKRSDKM